MYCFALFTHLSAISASPVGKSLAGENKSHFDEFPDLQKIIDEIKNHDIDWDNRYEVRDRALLLLRMSAIARGVDVARTHPRVRTEHDKVTVWIWRKQKHKYSPQELRRFRPHMLSAAETILRYLFLHPITATATGLFRAGHRPFQQLTSDRVNSITRKLLEAYGWPKDVRGYGVRGATVDNLFEKGFSLQQVQARGEWVKMDTVMNFYSRWSRKKDPLTTIFEIATPENSDEHGSRTPPEDPLAASPETCRRRELRKTRVKSEK